MMRMRPDWNSFPTITGTYLDLALNPNPDAKISQSANTRIWIRTLKYNFCNSHGRYYDILYGSFSACITCIGPGLKKESQMVLRKFMLLLLFLAAISKI